MICTFPDEDAPIRQGDIFVGLPRVEVTLKEIVLATDHGQRMTDWQDVMKEGKPVAAILPVRPVSAIVATQDCDATRSPDVTLCEIGLFRDVEGKAKNAERPKAWQSIITQHARYNLKWFYLPPDERVGFESKHAVDFTVTLRVPRRELEDIRGQRKGRLNDVADEHFRERLSEFFRRYPYDEWYPLDQEELEAYSRQRGDIEPYPWQKG